MRHLGLRYSYRMGLPNEVKQLLRLCKEVVDLHFGNLWDPVKDLFGYSPDLSHPLLRSITHLDIRDMGSEFDFARVFPQIPTLPALTYLALRFEVPRDNVLSLLAQCPSLKLPLLWPRNCIARYRLELNPSVCDVRFVIGLLQDYWKD
ncbi:hypothetical protein DFH08DRAFT_1079876 [Mycena albidolilacea]|uniref:Uncharacterized protein n=1 Tax=Mycena albidolilacea TaxID=1033008 RepID=A0AAD7A3S0_9AGAR|nr:hypothetical protein DFH08DRAFT_1079876 [Mycena albidolilacea]